MVRTCTQGNWELYILIHKHEAEREKKVSGNSMICWNIKVHLWDTLPPTKPHFLILPKQFHQLGSKHSNIWTYGSYSHHNLHIFPSSSSLKTVSSYTHNQKNLYPSSALCLGVNTFSKLKAQTFTLDIWVDNLLNLKASTIAVSYLEQFSIYAHQKE